MNIAAKEEVYEAVYITPDKCMDIRLRSCDAETKANCWSIADAERNVSQLGREIYSIWSNE